VPKLVGFLDTAKLQEIGVERVRAGPASARDGDLNVVDPKRHAFLLRRSEAP
jgi:hypothetical protein